MIQTMKNKIIVSCQAWPGTPFYGDPRLMRAMAESALMGGAGGIRANGADDIREIKTTVDLPVIGINKLPDKRGVRIITPDFESARVLAEAGADLIAVDATVQSREDEAELQQLIQDIQIRLRLPVMADISNVEEAVRAERLGANVVATTMAGYTSYTKEHKTEGPDFELISRIVEQVNIPVIGEGRFALPSDVCEAIKVRGAHSVVIGTSITAPWEITARFARAI
ncbi:N-acetylmannosamine-6-phosphate 2-epimerase [Paenibacillus sp. KQZ6P-2]|uniref:N-acylglucosamine-6-phosphate 2-epimerase n=1 Tax=Paenibacillus mangrovi TaxID=2931978 RepID=A0A9X1WX58_9BACL|nr:N-acetylmannosamine-6-phosphate 2-epimerase [Paenibacillus mangrovi]MCJ8013669.1 N-acetylmannosamine-6-phosphate 2-epimerase [Paenibacillus mangrovi]